MKVAICIKYIDGNPRFSNTLGSSDEFFIYDIEKRKLHDKFTNHFKSSPTAEIFCAQLLIKRGVNAVVCGKCGNDAKNLFVEANIEVIENVGMRPTEFVNILYTKFKQNNSITV
jgi:predicted Fe-Mo cluster-binding NifX family protein